MEQFNKYRSPIVMGVLILFLLLFAFFMLGVKPTNEKIDAQQAEIEQVQKETDILQQKIDELKRDSGEESKQQELLDALPTGDDSEGLINAMRDIGQKSETRLKDVSFALDEGNPIQEMAGSAEVRFPTVKQIKMNAVVEGTYTGIREWMNELQTMPRIVNVDSFNFQQTFEERMEGSPDSILTANVAFSAYYEEAAPAANP